MGDHNIWFYTFSTSAQVLSALSGLFAVFVVYKIQSYSLIFDDIRGAIIELLQRCSSHKNYNLFVDCTTETTFFWDDEKIAKKFKELLIYHNNLDQNDRMPIYARSQSPTLIFSYFIDERTENIYTGLVNRKSEILKTLILVLLVSLASIAYCIYCLSYPVQLQYADKAICLNFILIVINLLLIGFQTYKISNK